MQEKELLYRPILDELRALLNGERDRIANAANTSALLHQRLPDTNWVGFYFMQGTDLVLGPFQGKPACVRIGRGKGVCGAAAEKREVLVVGDVHAFAGHIACDVASRSEVVVPLVAAERVLGVLDVDSPLPDRFDAEDGRWLKEIADVYLTLSDWP